MWAFSLKGSVFSMTETTTTENANFPYGTFAVPQSVRVQYNNAYLSNEYPLPEVLPMHHPVLQQLEGIYPVVDALPPWWNDYMKECDPIIKSLLQEVNIREFRAGAIDQQRWQAWREQLPEPVRQALQVSSCSSILRSPKILSLLSFPWREYFEERGDKDTPQALDLVISFRPEFFLNMSSGNGWKSCQHLYHGSVNACLPANWYDTGLAVAMLLPRGVDIWEGAASAREGVVLARTTLRIFPDPRHEQHFLIAICRTYSNNPTLLVLLLSQLIALFEEHQCSWSVIDYGELQGIMETGLMGAHYHEAIYTDTFVKGIPFWKPDSWSNPYVDSDEGYWDTAPHGSVSYKTSLRQYTDM
jgi:hypothetical protein